VLVATADRGWAVIERIPGPAGRWLYRYQVVADLQPTPDGGAVYTPVAQPTVDPLGLVRVAPPGFLDAFHDEQQWLQVTSTTWYPDGVVGIARHLLWAPGMEPQEQAYAPDLLVTARPGWVFGTKNDPGTAHGYPFWSATYSPANCA